MLFWEEKVVWNSFFDKLFIITTLRIHILAISFQLRIPLKLSCFF